MSSANLNDRIELSLLDMLVAAAFLPSTLAAYSVSESGSRARWSRS